MVLAPTVAYTHLPYAANYNYYFVPGVQTGQAQLALPVSTSSVADVVEVGAAGAAPVEVVQAPFVPIQSQYHAQDEFGQYQFGYQVEWIFYSSFPMKC